MTLKSNKSAGSIVDRPGTTDVGYKKRKTNLECAWAPNKRAVRVLRRL